MDSSAITLPRRLALQHLALASLGVAAGGPLAFSSGLPSGPYARQGRSLLIRGGRVVNADGTRESDVLVIGDRIAEVAPGLVAPEGARVIDARRRLVIPGGIDPHAHLFPPFADDLTTGTAAALAGGITTVGTFFSPGRDEDPVSALNRVRAQVESLAIADVMLHAALWPPLESHLAAIPALAARGQPSIKVYMLRRDWGANLPMFIRMLEAARSAGVVTMIHCEDFPTLDATARRLTAQGRTSLAHYGESRPVLAEVAATAQAVSLCELTRAPIHIVHLSSSRALAAARNPAAAGLPISIETRPLYLHLTDQRMSGPDAPLFVGQPPLRQEADRDAMWRGLIDGTIDMLATDHAPWTRAQKLDPALTITSLRPGVSDLRWVLPMYFSEGVGKRRLSLERFVATTSTNAARTFGLFPQRGVIREGAIADICLFDPDLRRRVSAEDDPSRSDYTVYEGWEVTGWPVVTIRRGEVVYEDGRVTASAGSGRIIARTPGASSQ